MLANNDEDTKELFIKGLGLFALIIVASSLCISQLLQL